MQSVRLYCHPSTPCEAVGGLTVSIDVAPPGLMSLSYELEGETARLRIPALRVPARRHGLWRHTCFEIFVRGSAERYREFNFSPSGEWGAYAFTGYRKDMRPLEIEAPAVKTQVSPRTLRLDARLSMPEAVFEATQSMPEPLLEPLLSMPEALALPWVPESMAEESGGLRLALCAVVEDVQGKLSYWATAHARDRPDFHRAESFVIELDRIGAREGSFRDQPERR